jgi:hypothetical protein
MPPPQQEEALPPFYIFHSSAKLHETFRVKVDWLVGLPLVTGRFGCPTTRGSMDNLLLNKYI